MYIIQDRRIEQVPDVEHIITRNSANQSRPHACRSREHRVNRGQSGIQPCSTIALP